MEESFALGLDFLKNDVKPLFDLLYIGIVVSGSTLMFKLFPKLGKTKMGKFRSVFVFATIISIMDIALLVHRDGFIDPEIRLGKNLFNYFNAVLFYHAIVKTTVKLWSWFQTKYIKK